MLTKSIKNNTLIFEANTCALPLDINTDTLTLAAHTYHEHTSKHLLRYHFLAPPTRQLERGVTEAMWSGGGGRGGCRFGSFENFPSEVSDECWK